jgi:hypothetical protein
MTPPRSAYAFPIHACERCWHGESEMTIRNKVLTACPKCGGTMREVGIPRTEAPSPCDLLCLVCARMKPWGIWDEVSGVAVCVECRDKARAPERAP